MRAVRGDLSRGCHPPRAAAPAHARRARGARAQRDPTLPLRALPEALRHAADGRCDDGPTCGPFDVRRWRGAAPAADVRRLPRGRHDGIEKRGLRAATGGGFVSAQAAVAAVAMQRMLPPEEAARGDFYALLAGLLVTPPSGTLLALLAAAGPIEGDPALARAWQGLTDASKAMDADAAAYEYDELFASVG